MTLCAAWVCKRKREESLYMIADSRLSGGDRFDGAPKLFPLERGDCALACAGATEFFYPVAQHIQRAINLNIKTASRAADFLDLIHTVVDITNKCLGKVIEAVDTSPDFQMIFAGYSVRVGRYCAEVIEYNKREKKMYAHEVPTLKRNLVAVIGDHEPGNSLVSRFRRKLFLTLGDSNTIEMQPLDVLMEFINDPEVPSVGGLPQMLKITKFLTTLPYGICKESKDGKPNISYYGRDLLGYETFPFPIYNIDTKETLYMKGIVEYFQRTTEETKPLAAFSKNENRYP